MAASWTVGQFTSAEQAAFPPSFHSQDVLPPDSTAQPRVMWMRACAGKERRGSTHSLECIAHSKVRCISSEAAPNRSALAGIIINTGETPGKHRGKSMKIIIIKLRSYYYYYYTIISRMVLLWYFCTTKLSGTFGKVPQKYHSRIKILMAFLWYFSESTTKVPQNYVVLLWYF